MKPCKLRSAETLMPLPETMTLCSTVDDTGTEHEITELMIRRACENMDADQLWPFASQTLCGMRVVPVGGAEIIAFPNRAVIATGGAANTKANW